MIKYKTKSGKQVKITKDGKVYVDNRYIIPRSKFSFNALLTIELDNKTITVQSNFTGPLTCARKLIGYWKQLKKLINWYHSNSNKPFILTTNNSITYINKPIKCINYEIINFGKAYKDYSNYKFSKGYWSIYESEYYNKLKHYNFSKFKLLFKLGE